LRESDHPTAREGGEEDEAAEGADLEEVVVEDDDPDRVAIDTCPGRGATSDTMTGGDGRQ
jgi:hypothetical protein